MQENTVKKYPIATAEVAKMLNLLDEHGLLSSSSQNEKETKSTNSLTDLPVPNLPVETNQIKEISEMPDPAKKSSAFGKHINEVNDEDILADAIAAKGGKNNVFFRLLKAAIPYILVFSVGVFLYYFFFTKIDFTKIFTKKTEQKIENAKESALTALEKQNLQSYSKWVESFYFDVSNPKVLDSESDNSGNGLTNFQKYLLQLNPKSYDSLGMGMADSEALALGINPLTGGKISETQKLIIEKYIDMEVVMNKLAIANLNDNKNVAGASITNNIRGVNPSETGIFSQGFIEGAYDNSKTVTLKNNQTNFVNRNSAGNTLKYTPPLTGADFNQDQLGINDLNIDESIAGRLEIPSLGVNVPIIWTADAKNFTKDLQKGVVHYPGTALPGQIGTSYISGHSSNYLWVKGNYNKVFSQLGDLADNTSFKITVVQKNGKDARLHYVVTYRKQYKATDQEQFQNTDKSVVALSTCWPVGSTAKRLVVFGQLTQVERD